MVLIGHMFSTLKLTQHQHQVVFTQDDIPWIIPGYYLILCYDRRILFQPLCWQFSKVRTFINWQFSSSEFFCLRDSEITRPFFPSPHWAALTLLLFSAFPSDTPASFCWKPFCIKGRQRKRFELKEGFAESEQQETAQTWLARYCRRLIIAPKVQKWNVSFIEAPSLLPKKTSVKMSCGSFRMTYIRT